MRLPLHIQPRSIVTITIAVAALMVGSALFELQQSRDELLHALQEHSRTLADAVERSSENILLATDQIEREMTERLLDNAYFIARLDSLSTLSTLQLQRIAAANSLFRINLFDSHGYRVLSNIEPGMDPLGPGPRQAPGEMLRPILREGAQSLVIGLRQARMGNGERYAVAVRRTRPGGGAIVLNLDAKEFVAFRKRIGIGKLIRDLGTNAGLDYVALQDSEGVIAATEHVHDLSRLADDDIVALALASDTALTRQAAFNGHDTFEVIRRVSVDGTPVGVLRIGLSMDEIRSTENRMMRRLAIMSVVLIALGAVVVSAIVTTQNYRLLSKRYDLMSSLTGNVLANMRDAVITLDDGGRITVFNGRAEELFGITAQHVRGLRPSDLPIPFDGCIRTVVEGNETEIVLACTPDSARILSVLRFETAKPDGSRESLTAVVKDLTETRRYEAEAKRREKLVSMGELAAGVAHEIRNPLNAISMVAQRFEREFSPRSGMAEFRALTAVLKTEIDRISGIIRQFLLFARPPRVTIAEVDLTGFLLHLERLFQSQAQANGVQFSVTLERKGMLRIDAEQLTQALLNLLQNALDATPQGGRIDLRIWEHNEHVEMIVRDNGEGIPKDQLDKIFDLYYTTKPTGTGVGLAMTQQIIAQHRGQLLVQSEVGKGTEFIVRIPV